jgi:hypothetical protein
VGKEEKRTYPNIGLILSQTKKPEMSKALIASMSTKKNTKSRQLMGLSRCHRQTDPAGEASG